jgi:predicted metal-dependent hydrolase
MDWIERARRQLEKEPTTDNCLPSRIDLPAIDRSVSVGYRSAIGRRPYLDDGAGSLMVRTCRSHRQRSRKVLRRWLAGLGRETLVPWLREVSRELGIDYVKTQVRGQKTRWGSCSSGGVISINFCLLFVQPELVRYLFIHELCHRRHFSHCRRYWALVASIEPDYQQLDKQLSEAWREVPGWVQG